MGAGAVMTSARYITDVDGRRQSLPASRPSGQRTSRCRYVAIAASTRAARGRIPTDAAVVAVGGAIRGRSARHTFTSCQRAEAARVLAGRCGRVECRHRPHADQFAGSADFVAHRKTFSMCFNVEWRSDSRGELCRCRAGRTLLETLAAALRANSGSKPRIAYAEGASVRVRSDQAQRERTMPDKRVWARWAGSPVPQRFGAPCLQPAPLICANLMRCGIRGHDLQVVDFTI